MAKQITINIDVEEFDTDTKMHRARSVWITEIELSHLTKSLLKDALYMSVDRCAKEIGIQIPLAHE